jgi:hypothetical protein
MLNAKRYAPMNARDKMPLEVTPIFFKLQRYDASKLNPPPAPGAAAAVPTPEATEQQAPPPTAQPAPGDTSQSLSGTSNPPQQ